MDLTRLDSDAVRSIQRLGSRGFESYLVGGCVRDLLLDLDPKDFDIATEARPQQVKRAFTRNCRIIGRRFKLAHLHFDGNRKILEVATFRSTPVTEVADEDDDPAPEEAETAEPDAAEGQDTLLTDDGSTAVSEQAGDADDADQADESAEDTAVDGPSDGDAREGDQSEGDQSEGDEVDGPYVEGNDPDTESDAESDDSPTERNDEDADLLILRDNEFGTVEEDAVRRDFTINALFLDPVTDVIIDYVGGMQDVEDRVIRTIGDPETRFREDPIRILRAAKFAGRLRFHFDGPTYAAMRATSGDLVRAAPPRVLEEILRLLRGGHALLSFQILHDVGGLKILLPHVANYLEAADTEERRAFWRMLDALDNHIDNGGMPSSAVTLGCIFLRPILHLFDTKGGRSLTNAVEEVIGPLAQELRLPRRDAGALKRICSVYPRFTATGKRRFRMASFLQDQHLMEAFQLFELGCYATGKDFDQLEHWRELIEAEAPRQQEEEPRRPSGRGRERSRERSRPPRKREQGSSRQPVERKASPDRTDKKSSTRKAPTKKTTKRTSKRGDKKRSKDEEVLTIEPETYDLSAFDRELAPREVPRFDTIVESQPGGKKRRRVQVTDDSYKPPPPPGGDEGTPPPGGPPADDVFGDW